jgi:Peptidase family M1 domain
MRASFVLAWMVLALASTDGALGAPMDSPLEQDGAKVDAPAAERETPTLAHADDVVDYVLRAKLDPILHLVHGEGTIHFRNASTASVHELWIHLYLNAFKNDRSVFLREPIGGFRGTAPIRDWGTIDIQKLTLREAGAAPTELWPNAEIHREGDADETDARVPLPHALAPGETLDLDVVWDDKLPSILERTGYLGSFHFAGQWFPKLARLEPSGQWAHFPFHHLAEFYADFGSYDVTLDVPSSFVVGATGPAVETQVKDGRRIERHVQGDIHDFAWTAYDRFDERRETVDGVLVKVLYPTGYGAAAARELAAMRFAIPHFRSLYGPYPYSVLTLVHPPHGAEEAGGMEYPTLITTGGAWYEPKVARLLELVTVHEFGHQYFYGLIATDETTWPFLDEGINSYAEAETLEAWLGPGSAGALGGFTLSDRSIQSVFGNLAEHDEPIAQPASEFRSGGDYSLLVYERTAAVLETLRRTYGDAPVANALRLYTAKYRFMHPRPDDLIACFESEVGIRAADALRTALFDKGWVDYAVTSVSTKREEASAGIFDDGGKRQTLPSGALIGSSYEGWVLVTRRGTLSFPVDIELTLEDGTTQRLHWSGEGDSVRLPYKGPLDLRGAVVDPDRNVILDDNPTNNHASRSGARHAPRVTERLAYWGALLLQAIAP